MEGSVISVIIPVYNVYPYLNRCVRSVVGQTYENLDIILIDDGSTDGSGQLCDSIEKSDARIRVFHQDNQGLSVARNTGLDAAKGEWIAFLDSDDWIQPEMMETLINLAQDYDVTIASCASHRCESETTPITDLDGKTFILNEAEIIDGLLSNEVVLFEVWNKLWKRSMIDGVRFVPGQVSEDVHFDRILFSKAQKIAHINKVMHNYLVNRPGNTNSSFKVKRLCIFQEFDQWYCDLQRAGKETLAIKMATIAAQFAIHYYEEAVEKEQPIQIRNQLVDEFKKNHRRVNKAEYYFGTNRIKSKLMAVSPAVYGFIWKIRIKMFG